MNNIYNESLEEIDAIFVHGCVDDAGLTPSEFRVYGHLARRAGRGDAFPSVAGIARHCQLHEDTVRSVLRSLADRGMIERKERAGLTSLYIITKPSRWNPSEKTGGVSNSHPSENKGGDPSENKGDEVTPSKLIQNDVSSDKKSDQQPPLFKTPSNPGKGVSIPGELASLPDFGLIWLEFEGMRRAARKPLTPRAGMMILSRLLERPQDALRALNLILEKGWQSFQWDWVDKEAPPKPSANLQKPSTAPARYQEFIDGHPNHEFRKRFAQWSDSAAPYLSFVRAEFSRWLKTNKYQS